MYNPSISKMNEFVTSFCQSSVKLSVNHHVRDNDQRRTFLSDIINFASANDWTISNNNDWTISNSNKTDISVLFEVGKCIYDVSLSNGPANWHMYFSALIFVWDSASKNYILQMSVIFTQLNCSEIEIGKNLRFAKSASTLQF